MVVVVVVVMAVVVVVVVVIVTFVVVIVWLEWCLWVALGGFGGGGDGGGLVGVKARVGRTLRWVGVWCGPLCVAEVVVWLVGWVYFLTRWGGKDSRRRQTE